MISEKTASNVAGSDLFRDKDSESKPQQGGLFSGIAFGNQSSITLNPQTKPQEASQNQSQSSLGIFSQSLFQDPPPAASRLGLFDVFKTPAADSKKPETTPVPELNFSSKLQIVTCILSILSQASIFSGLTSQTLSGVKSFDEALKAVPFEFSKPKQDSDNEDGEQFFSYNISLIF